MKCLQCEKEFKEKRESAKFCSDNCRVKWNRKNGKKIKPFQIQVLINQLSEKIESMDKLLIEKIYGMNIQDLTKSTNQFKAITEPTSTSNVTYTIQPEEKPNLSPFDGYKTELNDSRVIPEVEMILLRVKNDVFLSPAQKKLLESYGKEVSKEMYND